MLDTFQQINSVYIKKSRLSQWSAVISILAGTGILGWSIINLTPGYQAGQLPGSISYYLSIGAAVLLFGSLLLVSGFQVGGAVPGCQPGPGIGFAVDRCRQEYALPALYSPGSISRKGYCCFVNRLSRQSLLA